MATNPSLPMTALTIFARREPTCDAIVRQYATNLHDWCDLVFYCDAAATQFYARRCVCLRRRLRTQPSRVMLNCFNWPVTWLPALTTLEVSDGDE